MTINAGKIVSQLLSGEKKSRQLFLAAFTFSLLVAIVAYFGPATPYSPAIYITALIAAAISVIIAFKGRREAASLSQEDVQNYRHIFELLPAAVYTTDAAGRITFYNEAAAELWGRRPVIGQDEWCGSWRIYTPDGTRVPLDECPMAVALKENRPVRGVEAVVQRPDGVKIPFLPYPTPIQDASGKLIGALNLLVNISDRKTTESALERRNKWLKLFSDASTIFAQATEPRQMMQTLFERIYKHVDADIFFNYAVEGEGENACLVLKQAAGVNEQARAAFARRELKDTICGEAALTRSIVVVNDLQKNWDARAGSLRDLDVRAYICQPLIVGDELIGTVSLGSFEKSYFDHEEIEFIKAIGQYAAAALKRLQAS
jgi:PAS domain S-box-containing protein